MEEHEDDDEHIAPTEDEAPLMIGSVKVGETEKRMLLSHERRTFASVGLFFILTVLLVAIFLFISRREHEQRCDHFDVMKIPAEEKSISDCITNFTNASLTSWLEFAYRAASTPQGNRCFGAPPNNPNCQCAGPLEPAPHNQLSGWKAAFARNLDLVNQSKHDDDTYFDVVMLGDSITEHWLGTDLGYKRTDWQGNNRVYQELFGGRRGDDDDVASIQGLALGIGGDRTVNLQYRILHGELQVNGKIYWILIGTNDRLGEHCSHDMIVAGNIHMVELVLARKSDATVVVSSILPNGPHPLAQDAGWQIVRAINERLSCYASSRDRVEFFNATDYFLTTDGLRVNETFMAPDMLHPSEEGSRVWGKAIVERVREILQR